MRPVLAPLVLLAPLLAACGPVVTSSYRPEIITFTQQALAIEEEHEHNVAALPARSWLEDAFVLSVNAQKAQPRIAALHQQLSLVPTPAPAQVIKDGLLEVYALEEAVLVRGAEGDELGGHYPRYADYGMKIKQAKGLRQATYQQWADLLKRNGIALDQFPPLRDSPWQQ